MEFANGLINDIGFMECSRTLALGAEVAVE
jgi:hypothetical protein